MNCNLCGAAVPDEASFCNSCGREILPAVSCACCNAELPQNSKFCHKCGATILPNKNLALAVQLGSDPVLSPILYAERTHDKTDEVSEAGATLPESKDRPYRWGRFQGGALVFLFPFGILIEVLEGKSEWIGQALFWLLYFLPLGLGITGKRRYAIKMVYGCLAISLLPLLLLVNSGESEALGYALGQAIVSLAV